MVYNDDQLHRTEAIAADIDNGEFVQNRFYLTGIRETNIKFFACVCITSVICKIYIQA